MADLDSLTDMLTESIYTPLLETDPAYTALTVNVGKYITQTVKVTGYTLDTLPEELEDYVILLVQKKLFRILAVARAPEYNVESEFTKIAKGDRFAHYMSLIKDIQEEIKQASSNGLVNTVKSYKVTIDEFPYNVPPTTV